MTSTMSSIDDLIKQGNCYNEGKLMYQQQTDTNDYLNGYQAYCLCEAKECPFYFSNKEHDFCNAYIKRKKEVI